MGAVTGGPLLLEDGDHGADQAAEQAEHISGATADMSRVGKKQVPGPGRGGDGADQQDAGLVHGAVQRHPVGGVDQLPPYCTSEILPNVLAPSAGLDVFISAIVFSPCLQVSVRVVQGKNARNSTLCLNLRRSIPSV